MRHTDYVSKTVLLQPKSMWRPTYAHGGIVIHFGIDTSPTDCNHTITIRVKEGTIMKLSLPSFTEPYSIILAILLMARSKMKGTIHTDYVEAIKLPKIPIKFKSMVRKPNLHLYQTFIMLLQE